MSPGKNVRGTTNSIVMPFISFLGAIVHFCVQISLIYWRPNPDDLPVFFVLAALWGLSDAVWQTHINGKEEPSQGNQLKTYMLKGLRPTK
jgi:hypothetical protein